MKQFRGIGIDPFIGCIDVGSERFSNGEKFSGAISFGCLLKCGHTDGSRRWGAVMLRAHEARLLGEPTNKGASNNTWRYWTCNPDSESQITLILIVLIHDSERDIGSEANTSPYTR